MNRRIIFGHNYPNSGQSKQQGRAPNCVSGIEEEGQGDGVQGVRDSVRECLAGCEEHVQTNCSEGNDKALKTLLRSSTVHAQREREYILDQGMGRSDKRKKAT